MVPTHLKRMLYFVDRPLQKTADGILGTSSTASAANECVVEPPHSERWEITLLQPHIFALSNFWACRGGDASRRLNLR